MPFKNDVWKIKLLFETVPLLKTMVQSSGGMAGKKLGFEKREHGKPWQVSWVDRYESYTLQGTNISHHWKRKIIFKVAIWRDMLVPSRVYTLLFDAQTNPFKSCRCHDFFDLPNKISPKGLVFVFGLPPWRWKDMRNINECSYRGASKLLKQKIISTTTLI